MDKLTSLATPLVVCQEIEQEIGQSHCKRYRMYRKACLSKLLKSCFNVFSASMRVLSFADFNSITTLFVTAIKFDNIAY